jgi:sec-independent protein translocase protein TatC
MPLLISSILLFYTGMAFAYFVVFKLAFSFFVKVAPIGVLVAPDIDSYLDFVLGMFFAFGLAFEVPIATVMLIWSGLVSIQTLTKQRRYVFLGAFAIAAVLTPPDVFSQTMLGIPMYLLYEGGLVMARIMLPEKTRIAEKEVET